MLVLALATRGLEAGREEGRNEEEREMVRDTVFVRGVRERSNG